MDVPGHGSYEERTFDRLVASCPTFLALDDVDGYLTFLEEEDTPDRYVRAAALAHHLADLLAAGSTGPVTAVLDEAEAVLAEADPAEVAPDATADAMGLDGPGPPGRATSSPSAVGDPGDRVDGGDAAVDDGVELVRMGLLEPLQNICSHRDVGVHPGVVADLLGPRGRAVWDELDELWRRAGRDATTGPRVTVEDYEGVADPTLRRYLQSSRRRMPDDTLLAATDIVRYHQRARRGAAPRALAGGPALAVAVVVLACVLALVLISRL